MGRWSPGSIIGTMRIGLDARLPYYQRGGISQYIINLVTALGEIDLDNDYLVLHRRGDPASYLPNGAANFHRGDAFTPCHHRLERWALGFELLRRNLDVFHSPDFVPPAMGASRRVITVHDLNFVHYPSFVDEQSQRYYTGQISWAVEVADVISADSEHTRQDLINLLGVAPEKVRTIHLAAAPVYARNHDPDRVEKTLRAYDLKPGYILFVGTISPRKNLPVLLAAYRRLRDEAGLEEPLVIVGGRGWLSEGVLEALDSPELRKNVLHLSSVDDESLAHLYSRATLLAMPSYYEGFGLPPLEAMHSGCPVVASNRASLPEVVGDAGILLDPDDVDEWFEALAQVVGDRDRRQSLIQAGYGQAARFSWANTAQMTLDLYHP
jgi:glycosyltransferase involved in cell wall biosynthesis